MKVFIDMDSDCGFIDTRTKVVWLDNLEQKEKEYVCGLKFIEISERDLKKLKIFLKSFSGAMEDQKRPELFRLRIWKGRLSKMG